MSRNSEYLTSNTAIAYPFAEDALHLARGTSSGFPEAVLVDALFSVPPSYAVDGTRLYVASHLNDTNARTVTLKVSDGSTEVLTFTVELPALGTAPEQWLMASAEDTIPGSPPLYLAGTLVFDGPALMDFLDNGPITSAYGTGLPFDVCTQVVANPALTSLDVYNAGPDGAGDSVDGAVTLLSGYNIAFTYQGQDDDGAAVVRVDAGPGLGRGQLPCTEAADVQDGPPGVVPLHGDVVLEGDRCYNIVPVALGDGQWEFQLQGRCQACCTCDDYAELAGWQKEVSERLNAVKQLLDEARANYDAGVNEFNTVIAPLAGSVTLDVFGMRGPQYAGRRGSPNMARIVFTVKNARSNTVLYKNWTVAFTRPAGDPVVLRDITVEADTYSAKLAAGAPLNYDVPAGTAVTITVLASVPLAQWNSDPGWQCAVTATVEDYVTGVSQTLTKALTAL